MYVLGGEFIDSHDLRDNSYFRVSSHFQKRQTRFHNNQKYIIHKLNLSSTVGNIDPAKISKCTP